MHSADQAILDPAQSAGREAAEQSISDAETLALGGMLGKRYEVQHLLGQGGMGTVYLARDRLTGQLVALKRVALQRAGSATLRTALAQEFRTLASLRHPNIVSVLDYGFDPEHLPFFTMEHLDAPRDLLAACAPLPLAGKLALVAQLLHALTYLHRHAILHRDLKPSNILVVQSEGALRLKVLDFGIAVKAGSLADRAGTAAYMAPEISRGEPPTPAADLYAVGQMLYQMLTQKPRPEPAVLPPGATTQAEVQQSEPTIVLSTQDSSLPVHGTELTPQATQVEETLPPATLVPPALANAQRLEGALAAIVAQLIDPDPRTRYQDAAAALNDLSAVFDELGTGPRAHQPEAARDSFLQAAGFVGRERELLALTTALAAASRGAGAMILVGGESGVGKSRLLEELRTSALVRGVRALRGQAVSDGGSAYQVFSDLLPQLLLEVAVSDQEAAVLKELVSELPALLGRPIGDAPEASPQAAQQRLHQTLLATLTRCREPMMLLLEDLHWAAPESLALLKELAVLAPRLPLLLVASYRDDERADLPQLLPAATPIKVPRLPSSGIAALSRAMLGEPGSSPQLLAFLERETEGNVFFLIEVVRALAEEAGSLEAVGTRELPLRVVSGGVSAIVRRRLERVPDRARPLLQAAAVAGRHLDLAVLRALEPRLDDWLQVCLDASVLEVNDAQWRFSHDKLREALLAALPAEQKRQQHRRVGEIVERLYGEQGTHEVALAFHFEQAGDLPKAARLAAQAGTSALRRGALHEAVGLLKRAESLQEQVGAPLLSRTATMRRLLRAYYGIDRRKECEELCRKAMGLLGRAVPDSPAARLRALAQEVAIELRNRIFGARLTDDADERALAKELLSLLKSTGDTFFDSRDAALLIMLFSLHAAEQLGDVESQASYLSWLGYTAYILPLHGLGKLYLERAAEVLRRRPELSARSDYHTFVGYTSYAEGQWTQSIEAFTLWISRLAEARYAGLQGLAYSTRCMTYLTVARWDEARADAERCIEIARKVGNANYTALGLCCRALTLLPCGEALAAYALTCEAQPHIEQIRSRAMRVSLTGVSALAALRAGQREIALRLLQSVMALMAKTVPPAPTLYSGYAGALEVALQLLVAPQSASERAGAEERLRVVLLHLLDFAYRFPVARPRVLSAIGRVLWSRGRFALAAAALKLGLSRAERLRMPYEQALCHLWLGHVSLAQGDRAGRPRLHLHTAETLLRDNGYAIELPGLPELLSKL